MGITTNEDDAGTTGTTTGERAKHENFAGADFQHQHAPMSRNGFMGLYSRIGISKMDKTIEPYLKTVMEETQKALSNVTLVPLSRLPNSYALRYVGDDGAVNFFCLLFTTTSEPKSNKYTPISQRLGLMVDELRENKQSGEQIRVCDARIVLSDYKPEMDRAEEMANTIVSIFQVSSVPNIKNANVESLIGPEFILDWRLSEARATESRLSPQGVRPRMDIGMTLKVRLRQDFGPQFRDLETDFRTVGVIGGFTDFREKEPVNVNGVLQMRYQPVFNITVCASHIPLEGIAMMMIASIAPTIYNTEFWARQFQEYMADKPNLGMLEEDPANRGRPYMVGSHEELHEFVRNHFAEPVIAFHFQDGADAIPGMYRMALQSVADKSHFASRLNQFVMSQDENVASQMLSQTIDERIDGVYGDVNGVLKDSRDIDFFWMATHQGWASIDQNIRKIMLGGSFDPVDRAKVVDVASGGFVPVYLTNVAAINAGFIRWFIEKMDARGLKVSDPDGREQSRPLGSMLAGFASSAGMSTFVTSGQTNRGGFGMTSIWGR